MADYTRSKSYAYGYGGSSSSTSTSTSTYNDMRLQPYSSARQPPPPQPRHGDLTLRCYSASYAQAQMDIWGDGSGGGSYGQGSYYGGNNLGDLNDFKLKKGKGLGGSWSGSKSASWTVTDPEFQRKKRVASYKMYTVEGKVKGSFRKSFRWLKDRYSQVVHGVVVTR